MSRMTPVATGALYALIAAFAFGATTPLVARYATVLGPWTIAALLYAGAAFVAALSRRASVHEARVDRAGLVRIAAAGIVGAMLAPAALAWGLARTGALGASLTLALESVFTIAIAALVFREHVGSRVAAAALLIAAGTASLAVGAGAAGGWIGLAAVAVATLLWSVDNALTGSVAATDPGTVVFAKCTIGAVGAAIVALVASEPPPGADAALALVAIGGVGYGASLRWYLLAQRTFGVARTASTFAAAPFVGAALAFVLGDRPNPATLVPAALAIAAGVLLHVTERHQHPHRHRELDHEHAHHHDDPHHRHDHDAAIPAHSHPHHHEPQAHAHPHAPDAHHAGHTHGDDPV